MISCLKLQLIETWSCTHTPQIEYNHFKWQEITFQAKLVNIMNIFSRIACHGNWFGLRMWLTSLESFLCIEAFSAADAICILRLNLFWFAGHGLYSTSTKPLNLIFKSQYAFIDYINSNINICFITSVAGSWQVASLAPTFTCSTTRTWF
jgi:hypothetical protein